jgi:hypothetical protein
MLLKAATAFGIAAFFHLFNFDLVAVPCFIVSLGFVAWWFQKFQRDRQLARPNQFHIVREVRADYQQPSEMMSRGSRGLPTSFD